MGCIGRTLTQKVLLDASDLYQGKKEELKGLLQTEAFTHGGVSGSQKKDRKKGGEIRSSDHFYSTGARKVNLRKYGASSLKKKFSLTTRPKKRFV